MEQRQLHHNHNDDYNYDHDTTTMIMRRWFIALSTIAVIVIVIVIVALVTRAYPVMIVNGAMVPMSRFEQNYASAIVYRDNLMKSTSAQGESASGGENLEAVAAISDTDPAEIEISVLDQLVTAVLIRQAAEKEFGDERGALVEKKLAAYRGEPRIRQGVLTLYGMTYEDFEREVLVPQAERDMLAGQLFLRGENIEDVVALARKSASIRIFSSQFRWNGEKIVAN